ncbi:MAG: hypothetical protein IIA88_08225 [Bacteroidetes bacterium]|nr:hypothetical protein [Bacteroidota bacterium]
MINSTLKEKSPFPLSFPEKIGAGRRGVGGEVFKNIIIFSKTKWNEPPRLRHQLTRLLKKNGHSIIFFEKNSFRAKRGIPFIYFQSAARSEEGIHFYSHPELLHHQLRPFRLLRKLNEYYELKYINKILSIPACAEAMASRQTPDTRHQTPDTRFKPDLIINFNYDYYFLKNLFPDIPIATIINDDFEAKAKLWMKKSACIQIKQTCISSDIVLTVSYPLLKKLKKYNKNTYLFFPWAEKLYQSPLSAHLLPLSTTVERGLGGEVRNVVLYYGYINNKLDWKIITNLAQAKIKLRFIGPVAKNVRKQIQNLLNFKNFELLPPTDIQNIDFDDVCCSIIPYDLNFKNNHSITVSNRIFNLLSYGIPIVNADLKDLIDSQEKIIQKCSDIKEYLDAIDFFKNNFFTVQAGIKNFLKDHYEANRYQFLIEICKTI